MLFNWNSVDMFCLVIGIIRLNLFFNLCRLILSYPVHVYLTRI